MLDKGLSASALARRIDVTPTAVWNWQQGNTLPRPQKLTAVADTLGVSDDWLRDEDASEASEGAPTDPTSEPETIAAAMESLRAKIAFLSGYALDRVKLTLEFSSS